MEESPKPDTPVVQFPAPDSSDMDIHDLPCVGKE